MTHVFETDSAAEDATDTKPEPSPGTSPTLALDNAISPDCIIESNDGMKYAFDSTTLCQASSVLSDALAITPRPIPPMRTLSIFASSHVVHAMLLILRQIDFQISSHQLAHGVVDLFQRYAIDSSVITPHLLELFSEENLARHPLGLFALAWRLQVADALNRACRCLTAFDFWAESVEQALFDMTHSNAAWVALVRLWKVQDNVLDDMLRLMPWAPYRCSRHRHLSSLGLDEVKRSMRLHLASPLPPKFKDIPQFFGLRGLTSIVDVDADSVVGTTILTHPCNACAAAIENPPGEMVDEVNQLVRLLVVSFPYNVNNPTAGGRPRFATTPCRARRVDNMVAKYGLLVILLLVLVMWGEACRLFRPTTTEWANTTRTEEFTATMSKQPAFTLPPTSTPPRPTSI
ncbi:hypothetical protein FRB99_004911 [Tulasnella sp. 403]|nr:hypothetical protein FRB99_004911 [Tulasnella sp. 403]